MVNFIIMRARAIQEKIAEKIVILRLSEYDSFKLSAYSSCRHSSRSVSIIMRTLFIINANITGIYASTAYLSAMKRLAILHAAEPKLP